jgi:hypothetical protein
MGTRTRQWAIASTTGKNGVSYISSKRQSHEKIVVFNYPEGHSICHPANGSMFSKDHSSLVGQSVRNLFSDKIKSIVRQLFLEAAKFNINQFVLIF